MYKGAGRNFQRRYKVREIDFAPAGFTCPEDLLPAAENMSGAEIEAERAQLARERVVAENQLTAARIAGREGEARGIGRRIQTLDQRAGLLGRRLKALNRSRREFAFADAVKAVVDAPTWQRILEEQERLLNEATDGLASTDAAE